MKPTIGYLIATYIGVLLCLWGVAGIFVYHDYAMGNFNAALMIIGYSVAMPCWLTYCRTQRGIK